MTIRIRIAETAGFCFGVQRALDKALETVNVSTFPVRTHGPLIHNEQVLNVLLSRGITELKKQESAESKVVVIRAHGIPPSDREKLKKDQACICDATCPKVAQVQAIVKKYANLGHAVAIVGDHGHAEVDGLLGYAGSRGVVISGPNDIQKIAGNPPVCVVAQTTQSREIFEATVTELQKRFKDCHVFDTICNATAERQEETIRLAKESDLMIVVGGKHSANTKRLAEIASKECPTILINSADDLTTDCIQGKLNIGVTAGASTPGWVIRHVVIRLKELSRLNETIFRGSFYQIFDFLSRNHLVFAALFVFFCIGLQRLSGIQSTLGSIYLSLWFSLAWSVADDLCQPSKISLNRYLPQDQISISRLHWKWIIPVSAVPILWIGYSAGLGSLICVIFAGWMVLSYAHPQFLTQLPNTPEKLKVSYAYYKDLLAALAALLVVIIFPSIRSEFDFNSLFYFLINLIFLAWVRSVLFDIRTLQVDYIYAKETLVMKLGGETMQRLLSTIMVFWFAALIFPVLFKAVSGSNLLMASGPIYYLMFLKHFRNRQMFLSLMEPIVIDAGFYLQVAAIWIMLFIRS